MKQTRTQGGRKQREQLRESISRWSTQTSEKEDTTMTSMQKGRHMMIERMDVRCIEMVDIRKNRAQRAARAGKRAKARGKKSLKSLAMDFIIQGIIVIDERSSI